MLRITLLTIGKLKESYLKDACNEYIKRLRAFCNLSIMELDEHRLPQNPSDAEIQQCLTAEGSLLAKHLPSGATVIPLCIEGKMMTSPQLAEQIQDFANTSSHLVFIIGGSHGLSDALKQKAHLKLSMSPLTFPHQLARVMLLEQIYRSLSILNNGKYHK